MSTSVYDQRYSGDYRENLSGYEIARWKALDHFITHVLKLGSAKNVLDYGSGSGLYVELWEKVFPKASLHFCDISPVAIEKLISKYPHHAEQSSVMQNDRASFNDATFDVIVSVEVMEHVDKLISYLQDVQRLLKPGGYFIWTTPCANPLSIEHIYSLLTGNIEKTNEGYRRWVWEDPTHIRRLKSNEIMNLLKQNGFSDVRFRFRSHLFSFICTYFPTHRAQNLRNQLMTLDYSIFRYMPNGSSMLGGAMKSLEP